MFAKRYGLFSKEVEEINYFDRLPDEKILEIISCLDFNNMGKFFLTCHRMNNFMEGINFESGSYKENIRKANRLLKKIHDIQPSLLLRLICQGRGKMLFLTIFVNILVVAAIEYFCSTSSSFTRGIFRLSGSLLGSFLSFSVWFYRTDNLGDFQIKTEEIKSLNIELDKIKQLRM